MIQAYQVHTMSDTLHSRCFFEATSINLGLSKLEVDKKNGRGLKIEKS
jgi:hypothetical protein